MRIGIAFFFLRLALAHLSDGHTWPPWFPLLAISIIIFSGVLHVCFIIGHPKKLSRIAGFSSRKRCFMSSEHYAAVLADLEARKAQIESAIAAIKMIAAQGGGASPDGGGSTAVGPSAYSLYGNKALD